MSSLLFNVYIDQFSLYIVQLHRVIEKIYKNDISFETIKKGVVVKYVEENCFIIFNTHLFCFTEIIMHFSKGNISETMV